MNVIGQTKDEHRPEKLEDKLFKNKHTIEKLRNERSRLANEHAKLQRNLVESTKAHDPDINLDS